MNLIGLINNTICILRMSPLFLSRLSKSVKRMRKMKKRKEKYRIFKNLFLVNSRGYDRIIIEVTAELVARSV